MDQVHPHFSLAPSNYNFKLCNTNYKHKQFLQVVRRHTTPRNWIFSDFCVKKMTLCCEFFNLESLQTAETRIMNFYFLCKSMPSMRYDTEFVWNQKLDFWKWPKMRLDSVQILKRGIILKEIVYHDYLLLNWIVNELWMTKIWHGLHQDNHSFCITFKPVRKYQSNFILSIGHVVQL